MIKEICISNWQAIGLVLGFIFGIIIGWNLSKDEVIE